MSGEVVTTNKSPNITAQQNNNGKDPAATKTATVRRYLKRLGVEREALECEMKGIVSELTSGENAIGIDTALVDKEGYPRGDIDIYRARTLRKRYGEIEKDLKGIMKKIEGGLCKMEGNDEDNEERKARLAPKPKPKFDPVSGKWVVMSWDGSIAGDVPQKERKFEDIASTNTTAVPLSSENTILNNKPSKQPPALVPFAVLDSVSPCSPSSEAGLHQGDLIVKFGKATSTNHTNLTLVAEVVSQAANENKSISVTVIRRRRRMNVNEDATHDAETGARDVIVLDVLPRSWSGRGLLGCHIVLCNDVHETTSN